MKNKKRTLINCILMATISFLVSSCNKGGGSMEEFVKMKSYFNDDTRVRTSSLSIDGNNELSLEVNTLITVENEKVRLVLNKNGSINEFVNKESKLFLVKGVTESTPIRLDLVDKHSQGLLSDSYTMTILENTSEMKSIQFIYTFNEKAEATCTISLAKNSDEVKFRVKLSNMNYADEYSVMDVEYPIIERIQTLGDKEKDVYAAPFATGFKFINPTKNFNDAYGLGIGKASSLGYPISMSAYPSGWGMTMQFSCYYSENLGGFYWMTQDKEDYIKNFTFTGIGEEELRMSIYHHVDDLGKSEINFDYDIILANLVKGKWEEAANRYKSWAINQKWVKNIGPAEFRTDINKKLFEKTGLTIFGFRPDISSWVDMIPTYDAIASRIEDDILNIAIYQNKNYYDLVREYNHSYSVFEFNTISPLDMFYNNSIRNSVQDKLAFYIHGTPFYYQCPKSEDWLENRNKVEQGYYDTYNVDALYFDVFATAVHPIECFDLAHSHGTRVNILDGFYKQLQNASDLADRNGFFSVGAEMITERTLEYIDFYQARANGGPLGWMETDEIRGMVDDNIAIKIPMFDRVYHEFGAIRTDGYLVPLDELGDAYYYIAGYTALNGGINEYNYEYFPTNQLPSVVKINFEMIDYVNRLSKARTTYGKNYMVYGEMLNAPDVNTDYSTYEYFNPNYSATSIATTGKASLEGKWTVPDIITSAYKNKDGDVAIFLTNVKSTSVSKGFILKALRDYGISNADVYLTSSQNTERRLVTKVKNGEAEIGLNMEPCQIYMLEIISK